MLSGGVSPFPGSVQPVWRSQDGGDTWDSAMNGLAGVNLSQLRINPAEPESVYGLAVDGVARSEDKGRTWQFTSTPSNPTDLTFGPKPGQLFLATFQGVLRSDDDGKTWQPTPLTGPIKALVASPTGDLFAAGTSDTGQSTLWRSQNEGAIWEAVGPLPSGDINRMFSHPYVHDYLILLMHWGGLQISLDGGRTWTRSDAGIPAGTRWRGAAPVTPDGPNLLSLFIDPENSSTWWVGRDGGGAFVSNDNGRTWLDATADLGDTLILSFAHNGDSLLAGSSNGGLLSRRFAAAPPAPPQMVDARIEILWPHDYAPVSEASQANLGMRLYDSRSQEPPPCAWQPTVEVWMARRRRTVAAAR